MKNTELPSQILTGVSCICNIHNDVDTLYPIFQQELRQNIIVVMLGKDNFYRDEDAS